MLFMKQISSFRYLVVRATMVADPTKFQIIIIIIIIIISMLKNNNISVFMQTFSTKNPPNDHAMRTTFFFDKRNQINDEQRRK